MKKGEIAHYVTPATLKEINTVSLGYNEGSLGVSIPIPGLKIGGYPIRYCVGQSRGDLIITSQRVFLNPVAGHKPLSVQLSKVESFHVYENGLEVWQDGTEHPYRFLLDPVSSEICGLCPSKLLNLG